MTAKAGCRPAAGFRALTHTGDARFKLWGQNAAAIFVQGAHALYSLMTDRRRLRSRQSLTAAVDAPDQEALLAAWLNHLLYLFDTREFLAKNIEIQTLAETHLTARLHGEKLDPTHHALKTGVKAATYHELALHRTDDGWEGMIVFDL